MTPSLPEHLRAWEEEYREKGRLWKGAPPPMPDLPTGSQVLELGCGNGKTFSAILRRPWQATALDISREAIRLCRKQAPSSARLLTADACNLPFRDAVFDAVFAFHVMGHLPEQDRRRMASEAARVLRSGGRLFFLGFGRDDMRSRKGDPVEECTFRRGRGILTHYFTEEEVIGLFEGLRPVSLRTDVRTTRIRGRDYLRSEVTAVFVR